MPALLSLPALAAETAPQPQPGETVPAGLAWHPVQSAGPSAAATSYKTKVLTGLNTRTV